MKRALKLLALVLALGAAFGAGAFYRFETIRRHAALSQWLLGANAQCARNLDDARNLSNFSDRMFVAQGRFLTTCNALLAEQTRGLELPPP